MQKYMRKKKKLRIIHQPYQFVFITGSFKKCLHETIDKAQNIVMILKTDLPTPNISPKLLKLMPLCHPPKNRREAIESISIMLGRRGIFR